MNAAAAIRIAVPILAQYGNSDRAILRAWLLRAGLSKPDAAAAERFTPLAFGRELLEGMGVALPDSYIRVLEPGGEQEERKLGDEPFFRAAKEQAAAFGGEAFTAIALQSSEVQAVNAALNGGASPENLVMAEPVIPFGEGEVNHGRPWWKLWEH